LKKTDSKLQNIYPDDAKSKNLIAHYWVRVGNCINPSCKAEVPLLKQFYLVNKKGKETYLNPVIDGKKINFEIKHGNCNEVGWLQRGNLKCPVCGNTTEIKILKDQFINGKTSERLVALIYDSPNGRVYKLPTNENIDLVKKIPTELSRPIEKMPVEFTQSFSACTWGFSKWGDLFSNRQIVFLNTLVESLIDIKKTIAKTNDTEYQKAILTYLGILIDRIAVANTSFGVWHTGGEKLERIMGRQALGMVFDYPESYPFCNSSGSAYNQMDWIIKYIESESSIPFFAQFKNASSGEIEQFDPKYITATITDPPYFDAIAYADLSDFFYVWLKRSLGSIYEENFSTPQTPKSDECTALKHHHGGDADIAKNHFENKLLGIFKAIEHQTSDIVSIMFAHQSTDAWTTLCNSILNANMNITGSWAIDTEMTGALKTNKQFLSSSVTVSAKPIERKGIGEFKNVKQSIETTISNEVELLYKLGFRGSDLLTACFGKAVSVFGEYQHVEKADGSLVTIKELLELTREIAFNSLLKGFVGDDYTKFYIGWLQLYGFTENDYNTAMRIVQIGLSINVNDLYKENILILNQNKSSLASYIDRINLNKNLGEKNTSTLIDQAHKAMWYFKGTRHKLLEYISKNAENSDSNFWRVITALCEVLPAGSDDYQQAFGLLTNKESLIKESKEINNITTEQGQLEF
jgi:adenine-specific DNA methylase